MSSQISIEDILKNIYEANYNQVWDWKKSIIKLISGPNQLISKQNKLISKQNQLISEQNKLISELIIGTEERGKIRPDFKFYNCYRHTSAQSTCLSQVIVFSLTLLFLTLIFFSKNPFLLISIVLYISRQATDWVSENSQRHWQDSSSLQSRCMGRRY